MVTTMKGIWRELRHQDMTFGFGLVCQIAELRPLFGQCEHAENDKPKGTSLPSQQTQANWKSIETSLRLLRVGMGQSLDAIRVSGDP